MEVPESGPFSRDGPLGRLGANPSFRSNLAVALLAAGLAIVVLAAVDLYRRRARHEKVWATAAAAAGAPNAVEAFWATAQVPLVEQQSVVAPGKEQLPPPPNPTEPPRIVIRVRL